jgi:radical SAM/Cys-rich protein
VGKLCNQTCRHCHVDAGPDRREKMTRETMQHCIDVARTFSIPTVDITGGAPELNPDFRWLVEQLVALNCKIIVRCNLTVILSNKIHHSLPQFFARNKVEVISSLPFYSPKRTDAQRGDGVFEKSISALQMLNAVGYGMDSSGLNLHLVYNPTGAFLPASQQELEAQFKRELLRHYGVHFNSLYVITNMPISRFLEYLLDSGNFETYMETLATAFNATAAATVMCRNTISVGWDGQLYDCDFNQMLDLRAAVSKPHIADFNIEALNARSIVLNQHCLGCTAGAGSSCGGQLDA